MKNKWILLVILIISMVIASGCGGNTEDQASNKGDNQTNQAETPTAITSSPGLTSFQTTDLNGNAVNQDIFKDYTLTLVNVWGTYCSPCIEEMPYLGELHREYAQKGVNVVGIVIDVQGNDLEVIDEQQDLAKQIVSETAANYTHLLMSQDIIDQVLYQFDAIPSSFFVDSKGNIVSEFYVGSKTKEKWVTTIEKELEK